jgi:hypothetical protein
MDSIATNDKSPSLSEQNNDGSLPTLQINPLSLMTSISSYKPVDDNQENILESTYVNISQSTDVATSSIDKIEPINSQKPLSIVRMDGNSIAAWVKSTTNESLTPPIERSPSLPTTIIEQIAARSRRESTASTLCDPSQQQQQLSSMPSDTMSSTISQNLSTSNDYQRSFSFPLVDQQRNTDDIQFLREENDDDFSPEFHPVQESEESEVDKHIKKLSSLDERSAFIRRSPDDEQRKKSPSVSFHASVSFDSNRKLISHRQRHNSWNKPKSKLLSYNRSQSHKIHSQIIPKTLITSASVPADNNLLPSNRTTTQSSSFSDNVFLSASPASSHHLQLTNTSVQCSQFLSMPSSTSHLSSDRLTSNISDASGRSGIESTNLRTSLSEAPRTSSIIEEEMNDGTNVFFLKNQPSSASSEFSRTPSTESLPTSSSDDEVNSLQKKLTALNRIHKTAQTPADQRSDVLEQLRCLLEKRPTINPRSNLSHRKQCPGTTTVEIILQISFHFCFIYLGSFIILSIK